MGGGEGGREEVEKDGSNLERWYMYNEKHLEGA